MAIKFHGDNLISSDFTRHRATRGKDGAWTVSWLPGRPLDRVQAITAMTIAEAVKSHTDELADKSSPLWGHIDGWAHELGLTGPHAVTEASLDPEEHGVILEAVRDPDQVANMKFLMTTNELGRAGTKVHVSAHGMGSSVDTAPFAVRGWTVSVPGGRPRGDAMEYFAEIIAELHAALSQRAGSAAAAESMPGTVPLPLGLEADAQGSRF